MEVSQILGAFGGGSDKKEEFYDPTKNPTPLNTAKQPEQPNQVSQILGAFNQQQSQPKQQFFDPTKTDNQRLLERLLQNG